MNKLNVNGDTIVEVLISVAVVGLVLGTAYVGANRAYDDIQSAQYHQLATTIAQTQLELLNNTPNLSSTGITSGTTNSCFAQNAVGSPYYLITPTSTTSSGPPMTLSSGQYANYCLANYGGYPQNFTVRINMTNGPLPGTNISTYCVTVSWPGTVSGIPTDYVKLYYQTGGA